jgi:hypothetical protein
MYHCLHFLLRSSLEPIDIQRITFEMRAETLVQLVHRACYSLYSEQATVCTASRLQLASHNLQNVQTTECTVCRVQIAKAAGYSLYSVNSTDCKMCRLQLVQRESYRVQKLQATACTAWKLQIAKCASYSLQTTTCKTYRLQNVQCVGYRLQKLQATACTAWTLQIAKCAGYSLYSVNATDCKMCRLQLVQRELYRLQNVQATASTAWTLQIAKCACYSLYCVNSTDCKMCRLQLVIVYSAHYLYWNPSTKTRQHKNLMKIHSCFRESDVDRRKDRHDDDHGRNVAIFRHEPAKTGRTTRHYVIPVTWPAAGRTTRVQFPEITDMLSHGVKQAQRAAEHLTARLQSVQLWCRDKCTLPIVRRVSRLCWRKAEVLV